MCVQNYKYNYKYHLIKCIIVLIHNRYDYQFEILHIYEAHAQPWRKKRTQPAFKTIIRNKTWFLSNTIIPLFSPAKKKKSLLFSLRKLKYYHIYSSENEHRGNTTGLPRVRCQWKGKKCPSWLLFDSYACWRQVINDHSSMAFFFCKWPSCCARCVNMGYVVGYVPMFPNHFCFPNPDYSKLIFTYAIQFKHIYYPTCSKQSFHIKSSNF